MEYNEEMLDSPETLAEVESMIKENLENKVAVPMNRAQRRAAKKRGGKTGQQQLDLITNTAKKLNYINLIQKLREKNKENKNNENITKNN